jgi:hypothetical protein
VEVAEIEEEGALLEQEVDVHPRVTERVVDQPGVEEGLHRAKDSAAAREKDVKDPKDEKDSKDDD